MKTQLVSLTRFLFIGVPFASLCLLASAQEETKGECVRATFGADPLDPGPSLCFVPCDPPPGSATCAPISGGSGELELVIQPGACNGESELSCSEFETLVPMHYSRTCSDAPCNPITAKCGQGTLQRYDYSWITQCSN